MRRILVLAVVFSIFLSFTAGQGIYAAPADESIISGKVVETMDSGGYSYVCLEKKGKKSWVAVPQTKITKGTTMSFQPGMVMTNFKSKTLNRTFDKIVFSGGPVKK